MYCRQQPIEAYFMIKFVWYHFLLSKGIYRACKYELAFNAKSSGKHLRILMSKISANPLALTSHSSVQLGYHPFLSILMFNSKQGMHITCIAHLLVPF